MEEPEKAKAGLGKSKTMKAAVVSNDGQPVQAVTEVGLEKVKDQSGKSNAGTEGSEAGTEKTEVEAARVRKDLKSYHPMTMEVLQINLHNAK